MRFVLLSLYFVLSVPSSFAVHSNYFKALQARNLVEVKDHKFIQPKTSLILPLSEGVHQTFTSLCWSFATLSFLETRYLVLNPNAKHISLSRLGMQRNTAEERALRTYILRTDTFVEGGTFINAQIVMHKYGLLPLDSEDYRRESYIRDIKKDLDVLPESQRASGLTSIVDRIFFPMPKTVEFEGKSMTPVALAEKMINKAPLMSFAFKAGAQGAWDKHPDPDALVGTQSWYVDPSMKESIIKKSLQMGYPVEMTFEAHCILIYGADYDDKGRATRYYLKDSYDFHDGRYTYEAEPAALHKAIWELGTVDVRKK